MRRRLFLVWVALAGCERPSSGDAPPDAAIDARVQPPPFECPPPGPTPSPECTGPLVCGNDVVERCWRRLLDPQGCSYWSMISEVCDGGPPTSCESLGYASGTMTCTASCTRDVDDCSACADPNLGCFEHARFLARRGMAVSGDHVALIDDRVLGIFGGAAAGPQLLILEMRAIVGVPGGWLVATEGPPQLRFVDTSGTVAAPHLIPHGTMIGLGFGPGNRALVAWNEGSALAFALTDATGGAAVATTLAGEGGVYPPSVTSSATHFFVAARGRLVRVAADGTYTSTPGFPTSTSPAPPRVTWGGTSGWYVQEGSVAGTFLVQRFDAAGMPAGGAFTLSVSGGVAGIVGVGDELELMLADRVALVNVDTAGVASAQRVVGAGTTPEYIARRDDGAIVLTFTWDRLYIEALPD